MKTVWYNLQYNDLVIIVRYGNYIDWLLNRNASDLANQDITIFQDHLDDLIEMVHNDWVYIGEFD